MNEPSVTSSGPLPDHDAVVVMCTVNPIPHGIFWIICKGLNLPPPPCGIELQFLRVQGWWMRDGRVPGNYERGLPVEWYGSLKNLSKNILKRGSILRQKLLLCDFLPPPPRRLQKLIMHQRLASFAGNSVRC